MSTEVYLYLCFGVLNIDIFFNVLRLIKI